MDIDRYNAIIDQDVVAPMIGFLEEWDDCTYTLRDVETCAMLLRNYLGELCAMWNPTDDRILQSAKQLVLALNRLNESTDFSIIETDQREAICQLIQESAVECGLKEYEEDITEQWRQW